MFKKLFLLIPCLFLVSTFTLTYANESASSYQSIHWQKWSNSAFTQAKREHKRVLLFGKVEWCHWCQKMSTEDFQNPVVIQAVQTYYIPVRIDLETEANLAHHYKADKFPLIIILDADKKEINRFYGYYPSSLLASRLRQASATNL